jgi:hypothetical protein
MGEGVTGAGVGLLLGDFVGEVVGVEVGLDVVGFSVEAGVDCGVLIEARGVLFGEGVMGAGVTEAGVNTGAGVTGAGVGEVVTGARGVGLLLGDFVGEVAFGAAALDRRRYAGTAPTVDQTSRWAYLSSRSSKSCALGDLLASSWLA